MEADIQIFIKQVKEYLIDLKLRDPDRTLVYNHFVHQCEQYDVSEEDFFKRILKYAYREINFDELIVDPDPPNDKNTSVKIFGVELHSFKKLGEVLFNNPTKLTDYFEDASLLKSHIDTLSDGDKAMEFAALYKSELDQTKRALRIIYRLNAALPYRIGTELSAKITELLLKGFQNYNFYNQVYSEYASGKLQLWLEETAIDVAAKLPPGKSYVAFLKFLYRVDHDYPFYLKDELFLSPLDVATKTLKQKYLWTNVINSINNNQLLIWLDSIGKRDWINDYTSQTKELLERIKHTEQEEYLAKVQTLITIIDPGIPHPILVVDTKIINFLSLEASKTVYFTITVTLSNEGFVKAQVGLTKPIDGIKILKNELVFENLSGNISQQVVLSIDPMVLVKDKLYDTSITISSGYENFNIPVKIKVVFPQKAYIVQLVKYGAIGAVLFALIRGGILLSTDPALWMSSRPEFANYISFGTDEVNLPNNYMVFFLLLLALITILSFSWKIIKKAEKLK